LKKHFSLAFILILLLNVLGYYGVFVGMRYTNSVEMVKSFDADTYDEAEEITIKVPITVAYMPDNEDFVRVNGKFEHQGEVYRLVKQKYQQDTLTIVCVLDQTEKRINQALSTYVKTFSEEAGNQSGSTNVTISFIKDYLPETFSLMSLTDGWVIEASFAFIDKQLIPTFTSLITHPPESI
jgi:hypothetical protein